MMGPRWLALPLAVLTGTATLPGCAAFTGTSPAPRMLAADMHVGSLDDRTSFELDDRRSTGRDRTSDENADLDDIDEGTDTPKKQRIRKLLYLTGLGAIGFGIVGAVGFSIGGRIVQAQMKHGYQDGDLTRAREDQLSTTGTAMNAMSITSVVIGLAGVVVAATVYGIDHARCGELRPRRKASECAGPKGSDSGAAAPLDAEGNPLPSAAPASDGAKGDGFGDVAEPPPEDASGPSDAGAAEGTSPAAGPSETAAEPAPVGPSPAVAKPSPAKPGKSAPSPGQ